ncbi:MAG: hypothetical protein OEW84_03280 [Aigarchaeota archaeon]|nr:hypothetical protein [Aigarchaeota archaeon]
MDRSRRKQELDLRSIDRPHGRLGGLRRRIEELRPFKNQTLDASSHTPPASDAGRREAAVAKANFETSRAQAYQAYWRTQAR